MINEENLTTTGDTARIKEVLPQSRVKGLISVQSSCLYAFVTVI